jgi:uncharacterized Ntn-hydrolase superfamily protein
MDRWPMLSTFSIVARDPANGDLGVAVQSKFLAVGSIVSWARAEIGAIATQALANVSFGPRGLELLSQGMAAQDVLNDLLADDDNREHRQVGVVDREGRAAAFTGSKCYPWAGHVIGEGYCCQGNILAGESVVHQMASTFWSAQGELAERLIAALEAGQAAGGDRRGQQSAALYVARKNGSYGATYDRYIDLRVDDHPEPIKQLTHLLQLHRLYLTAPHDDDLLPINAELAGELQDSLRDLGYYSGPNTNTYDRMTREALFAYGGIENLEQRIVEDDRIDRHVLDFIRRRRNETKRPRV